MTRLVFGVDRVCGKCAGSGVFATPEDGRKRSNELSRISRIEKRTGEPQTRPPFLKSECPECHGSGVVR